MFFDLALGKRGIRMALFTQFVIAHRLTSRHLLPTLQAFTTLLLPLLLPDPNLCGILASI